MPPSSPAAPETPTRESEALLRLYLTGALAEEEAEEVELQLLADDDFFALAEAVERDVLADCARGGLSPEAAASVRRRFSASAAGRARLALAEDLTALTRTAGGPEALLAQVDLLLEESRAASIEDPQRAEEPARRALAVVDRLAEKGLAATRLADLRARAWSRIANGMRVRADLLGAAAAFETARDHLRQGSGDALERARLLKLEAALLRDRRQFDQALDRLREVVPVFVDAGEDRLAVEALVGLSIVYAQAGEPEQAIAILRQALDLVDPEKEPRLSLMVRHNLIDGFIDAERFHEAEAMLALARPLYARFPDLWTQNRLHWIEGRIARGLRRLDEAEASFQRAREGFLAERIPYDVALVSLDLASLYAEQGRTEDLKPLAREVVAVFSSYAIHREALAALLFLEQAAAAERASLELVARVASFLERARHDPELRFQETADG